MSSNKIISVITPVFNAQGFLKEAWNSLLTQTYEHWEWLIIDDGSTDECTAFLDDVDDLRIRMFRQEHRGVSAARNIGLRNMSGDYFCFLDADDIMPPESLSSRLNVLESDSKIHFVDGAVERFQENPLLSSKRWSPSFSGDPTECLLNIDSRCFFGNTWMIRRDVKLETSFKEGMTHSEDLLFYLSICRGKKLAFTPETVLLYRQVPGSAMRNLSGLEAGYRMLVSELAKINYSSEQQAVTRAKARFHHVEKLAQSGQTHTGDKISDNFLEMNTLVMTYWSFKEPLIQAATLPHLAIIRQKIPKNSKLYLLTLEKQEMRLDPERKKLVQEKLSAQGIEWISFRYRPFGFLALVSWAFNLIRLLVFCLSRRIKVLHAFGSPIGTAAHIIYRLTGKPYVIDSFEPHSESMVENGSWSKGSFAFKLLFHFEKKQARHAKAVFATTEGMREYTQTAYGFTPKRFFVKPACVDLDQFSLDVSPDPEINTLLKDKVVCVYAGKIGGIYLDQEIFGLMAACEKVWGDDFRMLLLSDATQERVVESAITAGFDPSKIVQLYAEHDRVPSLLACADFAINPVKPVPSKRYCTSIKDGEYWAMGLPIIIPDGISDDSGIIRSTNSGAVLDNLDDQSFENAALKIKTILQTNEHKKTIRELAIQHRSYSIADNVYQDVYADGIAASPVRNHLVLIYNSYGDPLYQNLVHQYILEQSRLNPMFEFDLITFEQKKYALSHDAIELEKARLSQFGIRWSPLTYHSGNFMLAKKLWDFGSALGRSIAIRWRRKPSMIIAFANTSAAISVILSQLLRIPMMVYSYEPHSEFLVEFGIWKRGGLRHQILRKLEWAAARRSKFILTGTRHMVQFLTGKTKAELIWAPSAVDPSVFQHSPEARIELRDKHIPTDKKVLIYVGKFGGIYYDDEIIQFCKAFTRTEEWFVVVLTPENHPQIISRFEDSIGSNFLISEAKTPYEVARWLSAADIGLSAIPPLPSQKFRSPVKVGEYLLCGLPYITCSQVSEDDSWARKHGVGVVLEDLSFSTGEQALNQLDELFSQSDLAKKCRETGLEYRSIQRVHDAFAEALESAS